MSTPMYHSHQQRTATSHNNKNSLGTLLDFTQLSEPVQRHLSKVYTLLTLQLALAALGSYISIYHYFLNPQASAFLSIFLLFALYFFPHQPHVSIYQQYARLGLLGAFGFMKGASIAPLVLIAIDTNPDIVTFALASTSLIFASFSIVSLLSKRREYLFLGAILSSFTSILFWTAIFNIFLGSETLFNFELYVGLLIFCGYIIYDTQLIVEKVHMIGEAQSDPIRHALELFIDFISVFIRILIILIKKEKKRKD